VGRAGIDAGGMEAGTLEMGGLGGGDLFEGGLESGGLSGGGDSAPEVQNRSHGAILFCGSDDFGACTRRKRLLETGMW
jgi:hypothetical protein